MKTITIPKSPSPFEVIINGVKHTYEAGTTVEVEDYIAEVIERTVFEFIPDPGGISWNDLTDKPFGETATGGDTLTWDGNTEGRTVFMDLYYHVSDAVLTESDLAKEFTCTINTEEGENTSGNTALIEGKLWNLCGDMGIYFSEDIEDGGETFKRGIYLISLEGTFVTSLTIPGYTGFPTLKKMDSKYMPDPIIFYVDNDKYLYETPDTSDPANRVTMQRLKKIAVMPCRKYFYGVNGSMSWYMDVCGFQFSESYGMVIALEITAYTAEYEPK